MNFYVFLLANMLLDYKVFHEFLSEQYVYNIYANIHVTKLCNTQTAGDFKIVPNKNSTHKALFKYICNNCSARRLR